MHEHPGFSGHLPELAPADSVMIYPIVRGEVLLGLKHMPPGRRRRRLDARAVKAFAKFDCHPVLEDVGDHYADLRLVQERRGLPSGTNDRWIAATAIALGARLVSSDSDVGHIDGLAVEDSTR